VDLIVAVALASSLALLQSACALTGKPKTSAAVAPPQPAPAAAKPSPPPEPLSVPQTQVRLPPPQPFNPDALPEPKPAAETPAPSTPRPPRRTAPAPKPEPPAPATAAPVTAAPEPAPIQEVLTTDERKRLQESADNQKSEISHLLTKIKSHHPTAEANHEIRRIQSLVAQSNDAEKRGDMRQADALAERALVLARGLDSAK
jgi:hypothetical protein